jgi:hypothetical protein
MNDREQAKWDEFVAREYGEPDWLTQHTQRIERWETVTKPKIKAILPKVWALAKGALR